MNISWVFASGYEIDPTVDIEKIKNIGPTWGSWKTWRRCNTDNVVCSDDKQAQKLIESNFHNNCNFFIHQNLYEKNTNVKNIKVYAGVFEKNISNLDDIICLHLASQNNDIVLLAGFEFSLENPKNTHYHGLLRSIISGNPNTQWLAVDLPVPFDAAYQNLPNLTCDSMENVLKSLL